MSTDELVKWALAYDNRSDIAASNNINRLGHALAASEAARERLVQQCIDIAAQEPRPEQRKLLENGFPVIMPPLELYRLGRKSAAGDIRRAALASAPEPAQPARDAVDDALINAAFEKAARVADADSATVIACRIAENIRALKSSQDQQRGSQGEPSKRDRPAKNPGGMVCEDCGATFIGEDWHSLCAVCAPKHYGRQLS